MAKSWIELGDKVVLFENTVENIESILKDFVASPTGVGYSKYELTTFGSGPAESYSMRTVRDDDTSLQSEARLQFKDGDIFGKHLKYIDQVMWDKFHEYIEIYDIANKLSSPFSMTYSMRHYKPRTGVGVHMDYMGPEHKNFSLTLNLYMNSDFDGGEIQFFHGETDKTRISDDFPPTAKHKPKAGDIVIFPSNMLHRVREVSSGERYNINTLFIESNKPTWYRY